MSIRRHVLPGLAVAALAVTAVIVVPRLGAQHGDDRVRSTHAAGRAPAQTSTPTPAPVRSDTRTAPRRTARADAAFDARPRLNPCAHNSDSKQVLVSLADQHVWLCAHHRAVVGFPVTSGRTRNDDVTPTGTYAVQALTRDTTLNPDGGGAFHVKYWIPFKWGMYGFHDAPWQTIPFGSPAYRTAGSRGCVHMRTRDIARLFHWVALGTVVRVVAGSAT